MATVAAWNTRLFGCMMRDDARARSLLRTVLSGSLPVPFVSRKGDTAAPLELDFSINVDEAGRAAWEQWFTYDLFDGTLPFTFYLPWGTGQPRVRGRLLGAWTAVRQSGGRWSISGTVEVERESLPRFSGGALA